MKSKRACYAPLASPRLLAPSSCPLLRFSFVPKGAAPHRNQHATRPEGQLPGSPRPAAAFPHPTSHSSPSLKLWVTLGQLELRAAPYPVPFLAAPEDLLVRSGLRSLLIQSATWKRWRGKLLAAIVDNPHRLLHPARQLGRTGVGTDTIAIRTTRPAPWSPSHVRWVMLSLFHYALGRSGLVRHSIRDNRIPGCAAPQFQHFTPPPLPLAPPLPGRADLGTPHDHPGGQS